MVKPDGSNRIMEADLVTRIIGQAKIASITLISSEDDSPSVKESASEETQKDPVTPEEVQASSKSAVSWIN